jgi:hypothetical protein
MHDSLPKFGISVTNQAQGFTPDSPLVSLYIRDPGRVVFLFSGDGPSPGELRLIDYLYLFRTIKNYFRSPPEFFDFSFYTDKFVQVEFFRFFRKPMKNIVEYNKTTITGPVIMKV